MRFHIIIPVLVLLVTHSLSAENFAAVGRDGTGIYSVDGGLSWKASRTHYTKYINGITSDGRGRFFAVGSEGAILVSEDDGASYRVVQLPGVVEKLIAIATDERGNFVIGGSEGILIYSGDDGATWKVSKNRFETNFNGVATDRKGNWVAVGAGGFVVKSTDNGKSWKKVYQVEMKRHMEGIAVDLDRGIFVAVGSQATIVSSDGGDSWKEGEIVHNKKRQYIEGVAVTEEEQFIAVGWRGNIFRSRDGIQWENVPSGTTKRFIAVARGISQTLVAVGFKKNVVRSQDSGETWKNARIPPGKMGHLEGVALNRLPDLRLDAVHTGEGCIVELALINAGVSELRDDVWTQNGVELSVMAGKNTLFRKNIAEWDSGRSLKSPGGITRIGGINPGDAREIKIDISAPSLRELSKKNNTIVTKINCQ